MADDANDLLNALFEEHGGRSRFSLPQKSIARALAELLSTDTPDPKAIATLSAMLPEKAAPGTSPVDLGNLTDRELAMLDWIAKKAAGKHVPRPERKQSKRWDAAQRVVKLLDFIEAEGGELTDQHRLELHNELSSLFGLTVPTPWRIWSAEVEATVAWPLRQRIDDLLTKLAAAKLIDGEVVKPPQRALPSRR